jgi:hypothetical protein
MGTSSSSSSSSVLLMAGSALLVAAAVSQLLPSSKKKDRSSSSSSTADVDVDVNDVESLFITDDEVCKIFDRLFMDMQAFMANLTQQIRQIQMSGQNLPDEQITSILVSEFERFLGAKQAAVFDEFNVDADCLEEAVWEFMDEPERHPKVVKSVERFQRLYETFSGESVVGWRPGRAVAVERETTAAAAADGGELLDAVATVRAAEAYFAALTRAMKELVDSFAAEGKDLTNPIVAQELSARYASVANDAGEEGLNEMDVSLNTFQSSIEHHSSNPTVARALTTLQMKQQQDIMSMGVPVI